MAALARRYLCIPATSAPSERTFSTAGNVVTQKRTRLSPDLVATSVFLYGTWDEVEAYLEAKKARVA